MSALLLAALLSALVLPAHAQQRCYQYANGVVRCYNRWWGPGRIAGIVIGAIALACLILFVFLIPCMRRRRAKRYAAAQTNYGPTTGAQPQQYYPQGNAMQQQPYYPNTYPQQEYSYPTQNQQYGQQGNVTYAPPSQPPPTYKSNGAV